MGNCFLKSCKIIPWDVINIFSRPDRRELRSSHSYRGSSRELRRALALRKPGVGSCARGLRFGPEHDHAKVTAFAENAPSGSAICEMGQRHQLFDRFRLRFLRWVQLLSVGFDINALILSAAQRMLRLTTKLKLRPAVEASVAGALACTRFNLIPATNKRNTPR